MKRTVMGLIAIVVAVASYAFVTNGNAEEQRSATSAYYFYEVVGNQIDPNSPLNDEPMTPEEFLGSPLAPCQEGSTTDCVRGWIDPQNATATGQADHVIKKD